jgi:hypothetical protein
MSPWRTMLPKGWRILATMSLILGVMVPVWGTSGASAQDEGSILDIAEAAPESSVIFWTFDLNRDSAQWQQTEELLGRIGIPNALDTWEQETLKEGSKKNQLTQEQLDALLGGEVAVAVTPDAIQFAMEHHAMMGKYDMGNEGAAATPVVLTPDQALGVSLILAPSDPDASWEYVQSQFADLAKKNDAQVEELTYGDSDVLWVAMPDMGHHKMGQSDNAGDMGKEKWQDVQPAGVAAARAGDYIVAGVSQADVEEIIDVVNGDEGSLADSDTLQQIAGKLPEESLSFTYVDGVGIIDALGPDADKTLQSLAPGMSTDVWRAQAGITISAEDIGFRTDSIALPGEGGNLETIASQNDPAIATAAGEAPAGTLFFEAGKLAEGSLATAPYAIAMAMGSAQKANSGEAMTELPTQEEIQAQLDAVNQMLGFDLKSDLFDLLGGTFILFSGFPNFTSNGASLDAVAAIDTTDPAKLSETTQKIADLIKQAAPDLNLGERDVEGDTLHVLKFTDTGEVPAIEFGVVGNQFVIGVGSGIDSLTGTPTETLADDPQFQEVMGSLPNEYYQVVYLDINQLAMPLMAMMGSMQSSDATPVAMPGAALANIKAFAAVGYRDGDAVGSSAILYIAAS